MLYSLGGLAKVERQLQGFAIGLLQHKIQGIAGVARLQLMSTPATHILTATFCT